MRLSTIFLIMITILLTVVMMQNNDPVYFSILFATVHTSKLVVMLISAVAGFVIGYFAGRPKRTRFNHDGSRDYEQDIHTSESLRDPNFDTLSDEDRDYISED